MELKYAKKFQSKCKTAGSERGSIALKDTVRRMRVRIKYVMKAYEAGEMTFKEVNATMQSYFGLISHCTNKGLREKIVRDFVLHCTDKSRERALQEI